MSCRASVELMSLRLDGRLGPPDAARLEEHLHSCATCAAEWAALREADQLLRLAARRPVAPPAYFHARVMQRVAVTPVARPQFWERERRQAHPERSEWIEGGRPTIKLHMTGPISGHAVPGPAGLAAPRTGLAGVMQNFHPLRNTRMGLYLGGMAAAGALSMLLIVVFTALIGTGSIAVPTQVQNYLNGSVNVQGGAAWATTVWSLLSDLLTQIGPWLAAVGAVVVAGLGLLWWRIVMALARRSGNREVIA